MDLVAIPVSPTRIDIAWIDTDDWETGFTIERTDGVTAWAQLASVGAGVTSYSDSGLAKNETWYYRVYASNGYGDSGVSPERSATTQENPDLVDPPKDHLAIAMQKSGSDLRAGSYYTYQYDGIGNRINTVGRSNYGGATTYSYNLLNQITERNNPGVIHVSGYAPADHTVLVNDRPTVRDGEYYFGVIEVDNDSGPVSETVVVTVVEHTAQGDNPSYTCFMAIVPKATETIAYDSRGNKLTDSVHTNTWDLKNRLIAVQTNTAVADDAKVRLEFEYDAFDRRIEKRVYTWDQVEEEWKSEPDETIKFVWDGWLLIAELDASDDLIRSYIWGLDKSGTMQGAGGIGGLLAIEDHVAEKTYWVASDHNGNVMNLVDSSDQSVVAAYEYSPYGELLTVDGTAFAKQNPFRFSTKYYDAEVGLYYFGYRYQDPDTGRWISRDPIGERGGLNLNAFVHNDPINKCDFLGLAEPAVASQVPLKILADLFNYLFAAEAGPTRDEMLDAFVLKQVGPNPGSRITELLETREWAREHGDQYLVNAAEEMIRLEIAGRSRHRIHPNQDIYNTPFETRTFFTPLGKALELPQRAILAPIDSSPEEVADAFAYLRGQHMVPSGFLIETYPGSGIYREEMAYAPDRHPKYGENQLLAMTTDPLAWMAVGALGKSGQALTLSDDVVKHGDDFSAVTLLESRIHARTMTRAEWELYSRMQRIQANDLQMISRWGRPGLQPDDWVMKGDITKWNYFWSGKWQPGMGNEFAPFSGGQSFVVPRDQVVWPSGWWLDGKWKGIFGQRKFIRSSDK